MFLHLVALAASYLSFSSILDPTLLFHYVYFLSSESVLFYFTINDTQENLVSHLNI